MDKDRATDVAELIASQCLAGRVRRLNRVVTNLYDRALQPYGIKINQANILISLLVQGETRPGEIGSRLQMEKSTVSRTLDRMKKSGWIETNGTGPGQTVRITEAGRQLMVDTHDAWQHAQRKATELLGEDGAQAILAIVKRLRQAR
ncbi:MarR family winged helix-turn-helix transcriptional regulator [Geobacter sp. SVR]|uniref:MarR family winged helix-turn-helix transcriptional regulator n=1 Tax=Geobacter sp. SVR TaxID=2495594 RepID=UPI0015664FD4|nr:MarR family winged helix-turn-helix transcriptional regulator [Geobacter sp. SVR]